MGLRNNILEVARGFKPPFASSSLSLALEPLLLIRGEAWRLMILIHGPLLKKVEFLLSILSGIPSEGEITALKDPEAIIRELKKTRQKLWEEKYKNWFE